MQLWPHQVKAARAAAEHLAGGGRATVIGACGTGKTITGAESSRRLAPRGRVLVVAPSIALVLQTARAYREALGADTGRLVVVCYDQGAPSLPPEVVHQELAATDAATTDSAQIAAALSWPGRATVVSTYTSLPAIIEAHRDHGLGEWDLIICDEAHRSVGLEAAAWAAVHDDEHIPARRRLYMTATPRILRPRPNIPLVSMDDTERFGPVVHRMTFGEAITQGLLADYEVLVTVVTDTEVAKLTAGEEIVDHQGRRLPAHMLATQVALLRAIAAYDLRRVLTCHARVLSAVRFAATLPAAADLLAADQRPTRPLRASHVQASMSPQARASILGRLADPGDGVQVVSHCRLLSEGVDVPELEAVVFADPRTSPIDIVQIAGRALRRGSQSGKVARLIIPVFLPEGARTEYALEGSQFDVVWSVLRALRAHDERLGGALDRGRASRHYPSTEESRGGSAVPRWLTVQGSHVPPGLAEAILLRAVETSSSPWWAAYGAARDYYLTHGHLRVPADQDPELPGIPRTGFTSRATLGEWLARQRRDHRAGILDEDRRQALEEIGMVWEPRDAAWEENFASAAEVSRAAGGRLNPPRDHPIAKWVYHQRYLRRRGELPADRRARLDSIGMVWDPKDEQREQGLAELREYAAAHGNLRVPDAHPLARRVDYYRKRYRQGRLSDEQIAELEALGMVWDPREQQWWTNLEAVREHHQRRGVPQWAKDYGDYLGKWVLHQRRLARAGKLEPDKSAALRQLGLLER
ncbi:DEAD/DEAH box helicase [Streptomonospora nanhaiensis]|uniref:DEAD/DEAH box helicase n=1 Tax=Streptomonospora nanhaiensis TaxID=1323731 RepID=UPI001C37F611|nr:DEAD/DEAH box helicase [Streptomonospora nanhaiensis]MBV2364246.1 Helicase associated domain protein [Streptomonospora nanhaiensis]